VKNWRNGLAEAVGCNKRCALHHPAQGNAIEPFPWPNEHTVFRTYQLHIRLSQAVRLQIGRLGEFDFPAGVYVYTGSAKRNFEARIARHMRRDKTLRWHIDYLLAAMETRVTSVVRTERDECEMNQTHPGVVLAPGFGASDCRKGCGSHLKYLGRCVNYTGPEKTYPLDSI
jgi:Uri superfamily endonuclease